MPTLSFVPSARPFLLNEKKKKKKKEKRKKRKKKEKIHDEQLPSIKLSIHERMPGPVERSSLRGKESRG